jgi:hypothetical protein
MTEPIFQLLACLGLVWILKYGTILNFIRSPLCKIHPKIKELFKCALCLGFWVGVVHSLILCLAGSWPSLTWFYYPFASAAFCWFMDCLLDLIQSKQIKAERELNLDNFNK